RPARRRGGPGGRRAASRCRGRPAAATARTAPAGTADPGPGPAFAATHPKPAGDRARGERNGRGGPGGAPREERPVAWFSLRHGAASPPARDHGWGRGGRAGSSRQAVAARAVTRRTAWTATSGSSTWM